ncbi:MAG: glycosyltransferase family 2 protein [Chitinispirillaceae bacterium]|nr:glycosyltransferase family 2 protein [Chitinispirillaceae bacterium]
MIAVSVIIPTCNRPDLLRRALASVTAQRTTLPMECLVADDGAVHGNGRIERIAGEFGAVYCTTGGNRGGGAARNCGVEKAKGTFLAFLDDDDAWEPVKLAEQVPLMDDPAVALSYTGIAILHRNEKKRISFRKPGSSDHFRSIMAKNFIGTTSSVVVRRSTFDSIGGFDTALPALQDYDLYIRLLRNRRVAWTPSPLTVYYAGEARDNISESLERFRKAAALLTEKYHAAPQYPLLQRSLKQITLLKCVRSRRFLFEYLRALVKGK